MLSAAGTLVELVEVKLSDEVSEASDGPSGDDVSISEEDMFFSSGFSERETSFRSPQPVIREVQSAAHKKTVDTFLIFIKTVLSDLR